MLEVRQPFLAVNRNGRFYCRARTFVSDTRRKVAESAAFFLVVCMRLGFYPPLWKRLCSVLALSGGDAVKRVAPRPLSLSAQIDMIFLLFNSGCFWVRIEEFSLQGWQGIGRKPHDRVALASAVLWHAGGWLLDVKKRGAPFLRIFRQVHVEAGAGMCITTAGRHGRFQRGGAEPVNGYRHV